MYRHRVHDALPPRFAILTTHGTRAYVFDAIYVYSEHGHDRDRYNYGYNGNDEGSFYAVRPHIPPRHDHNFPAFMIDGASPFHAYPPHGQHGRDMFVVEDPRYNIRFRTEWHSVGRTLYSMLDANPIPVINIDRNHDLPCLEDNCLRVVEGDRRELHLWEQRWNPHVVIRLLHERDRERDREERRARPPAPAPVPVAPTPVPKFVANALIRDAVAKNDTCPITMEPLTAETTAVTHCFHLFERNAIATWLASDAGHACAVCKTPTVLTL